MPDVQQNKPMELGIYGRQPAPLLQPSDIISIVLSVVWIALVAGFWFFLSGDESTPQNSSPLIFVMTVVSILLPIGLIWLANSVAKTGRVMRNEAQRLETVLDALRKTYVDQSSRTGGQTNPAFEKQLEEIAKNQKHTADTVATFASRRDGGSLDGTPGTTAALGKKMGAETPRNQATLGLDAPSTELLDPITIAEFIRAMNFPENEDDTEGFRTLRRALDDRDIAKMIRASQDVLTLLSQDGIYMDDLKPAPPPAAMWRRFAQGTRGASIATVGGVHDRSCLALAAGRMKSDHVFRDATHHFLRQFDSVLGEFEANATDSDLLAMGETRTARAFMLLGRIAGTFD